MPLKNQVLDDLGQFARFNTVDIAPGSPFECSTIIPVTDTPLCYPTGNIDVSNYAAVAVLISGTSTTATSAFEAGMHGNATTQIFGWPIAGNLAVQPNSVFPTAFPGVGQKNTLYIIPVETANIFRIKLQLQTDGITIYNVGLLSVVPTIPGLSIAPRDYPVNFWSYAAASGGITNTTAVTIKASAGSGGGSGVGYSRRIYCASGDVTNISAVPSEFMIRDGAGGTVLYRGYIPANSFKPLLFTTPLKGSPATLMEVVMVTTATQTYFNFQGWQGN